MTLNCSTNMPGPSPEQAFATLVGRHVDLVLFGSAAAGARSAFGGRSDPDGLYPSGPQGRDDPRRRHPVRLALPNHAVRGFGSCANGKPPTAPRTESHGNRPRISKRL